MALGAPPTTVFAVPRLVATCQQASPETAMPGDAIPISHLPSPTLVPETPEVASIPNALQSKTHLGTVSGTLSDEVLQIQEEMNRAMGQLLTTRVSIDAHCRKQVSDTETAFHQNEAQTTKAIKDAKAHCTTMIQNAEATCTAAIMEAEATCAEHAHALQQSHGECMQEQRGKPLRGEGGIGSLF